MCLTTDHFYRKYRTINGVKYNRTLTTMVSNQDKELTVLEGEEDLHILDICISNSAAPMEVNMVDIGDQPNWLNFVDVDVDQSAHLHASVLFLEREDYKKHFRKPNKEEYYQCQE